MTFAEKLRRMRGVKGRGRKARGEISQAVAAAALGVNLRTYQDWEGGRHEPAGFALDHLQSLMAQLEAEKNAGRPVASSNRKAKGTPTGIGTGSKKRVTNAKGKNKA